VTIAGPRCKGLAGCSGCGRCPGRGRGNETPFTRRGADNSQQPWWNFRGWQVYGAPVIHVAVRAEFEFPAQNTSAAQGCPGPRSVPLRQFLGDPTFRPDDLRAMETAFEAALDKLGLKDRTDPATELVAKRPSECERDPA
jgi:hypothetical protein